MELGQLQHDRPAACVVARLYSSATFVSFSFHTRKEKSGTRLKILFSTFLLFKHSVCLKFRNTKLDKSGSASNLKRGK